MLLFILGLILFFSIHMLPFYPEYRAQLIEKLDNDTIYGEGMYKIIFSVISLLGLIFVGIGKGSIEFIGLWDTLEFFRYIAVVLILVSFILMVAAYMPNNIRRYVPHPMLTGVIIWGVTHMLVNGDVISLILFASFVAYSVMAIKLINRRDQGKSSEQDTQQSIPVVKDAIVIGIATFGWLLVLWLHKFLFGRAVFL
ncbi:MAG: NnrU family protein [Gammaproteobacteria bacterium]|nr:MAG: NnrU family protein [Gammaproteobacteria bacterium]